MTPKPMKPVKAWAVVDAQGNYIADYVSERFAEAMCRISRGEFVVPITITEDQR